MPPLDRKDRYGVESPFTTTIFASNIHCSSCASHIQDIIQQPSFSNHVQAKNINVVSGEIIIAHDPGLPVDVLCSDLAEAAFEIECATTVDEHDRVLSEIFFKIRRDGLLEDATDRLHLPTPRSPILRSGSNLGGISSRSNRRRHVEVCVACQSKEQTSELKQETPILKEKERQKELQPTLLTDSTCKLQDEQHAVVGAGETITKLNDEPSVGPRHGSESLDTWVCDLSIVGMTCSTCSNAVYECLKRIPQVRDIEINLLTNSASIRYSGTKAISEDLVREIGGAGFEASIHSLSLAPDTLTSRKASNASTLTSNIDKANGVKPTTTDIFQAKLSIGGMTCSACTNAISQSLNDLPCVREANVNLLTNSAEVVLEGKQNLSEIITAVEDVGFECSLDGKTALQLEQCSSDGLASTSTERRVQIIIEGFFCEQCPGKILEELGRYHKDTIGVDQAPSLQEPVISLTYTPDQEKNLTIREVLKVIATADPNRFSASIYHPPSIEERSRLVQAHERSRLLRRLALSFVLAIPTFIIGVLFMDLMHEGNSVRQYLMERMWAGQVPRAQWALLFLSTPAYLFAADVFHLRAVKEIRALWNARSRVPIIRRFTKFGSMNLLVSAGTTVAYVSSIALLITSATTNGQEANQIPKPLNTYFDTVVFLTFFILIGRFLEAYSKSKAGDAVGLLGSLRPESAILVTRQGDYVLINADLIEIGDHILIRRGQSPAADGHLTCNEGVFDESSLTGESRSIHKFSGDKVFAGTINAGPPVMIRVTNIGGSSMLDQIIAVVREGQTKRAPVERIADVITGYFVPVITALAILTFAVWVSLGYSGVIDPRYIQDEHGGWTFWSLEFAIAVFVVACPCGIGLAAPTALYVGGGLAAKNGILARGGGQAFQDAGQLDAVVFDKTGTLTEGGNLKVTNIEIYGKTEFGMRAMIFARALEIASAHPIAVAIAERAEKELGQDNRRNQTTLLESSSVVEIPGRGMEGVFKTTQGIFEAKIGSPGFVASLLVHGQLPYSVRQKVEIWEHETKSVVVLATRIKGYEGWDVCAIFAVEDAIRSSAQPTVESLQNKGLEVYMLTGDNWTTARAVASRVNIKPENVFAGILPTEKADKIEWLQRNLRQRQQNERNQDLESQADRKRKPRWTSPARLLTNKRVNSRIRLDSDEGRENHLCKARVAFVGDGINDAPALTRADISVSPCNGSPIAMTSSSFILMSPSLAAIPKLLEISTKVFRRVRFNFIWALMYNSILVPVAAGILFRVRDDGFRLGPVWGSLAMALSSVSVIVSSLFLRWESPWPWQWYRKY